MQTQVRQHEPRSTPFQVKLDALAGAPTLDVSIDGYTARKRVGMWLFDDVATMLMGHTPQLVIERERVYWRVPVVLTSKNGIVGEVGAVNVDAQSGELATTPTLAAGLITNAQTLLAHNAATSHPSSNAA